MNTPEVRININLDDINIYKIFSKILINKENSCWEYTGAIGGDGYGRFSIYPNGGRKYLLVHRIMFKLFKEDLVSNKVIDHICMNRKCCNPDHLRQVTLKENAMENTYYAIGTKERNTTHCPSGHEYTEDNTYLYYQKKTGKTMRNCVTCRSQRSRKQK